MSVIHRDPAAAAGQTYDVIIVGGGIYGVMLAFEASRRGLSPLLIERDDFGGATSFNSLRIIHGGFRYLQTLDIRRFYESVRERHWFLRTFPELVKPLSCLMPLYGEGIRCPSVLRIALLLNDTLSCDRNRGIRADRHLPPGKILSPEQVKQHFPMVDPQGLTGGAMWHDACMPDSQRLLIEILRWSCALGAIALNYVEAQTLLSTKSTTESTINGILAQDTISGEFHEFRADTIINAAGPWSREVATQFDRDIPHLFQHSLAWNILFDRAAPSDFALAIKPKRPQSSTYFLHPWKGRLLAGTIHNSWTKGVVNQPIPSGSELNKFILDLNQSIPNLDLKKANILRIFSGFLPATYTGSAQLSTREVILKHAKYNGPQGLYSVSGVKFTTSRLVAQKTIESIFKDSRYLKDPKSHLHKNFDVATGRGIYDYHWLPNLDDSDWQMELRQIIDEESVHHMDDLILRRTSIGDNPHRALAVAPMICKLFDWNHNRCQEEIARLEQTFW